eukprot:TRINITY_DN271_c0_g1_i3.p1 TRINITY_DN271_c0_g1~~TRINITY_DN271_c0_g1_i3.p1  ORF type:complete len:298 (-),score=-8.28 TRINITY_DN271_c0_g1_i3:94-987(-)
MFLTMKLKCKNICIKYQICQLKVYIHTYFVIFVYLGMLLVIIIDHDYNKTLQYSQVSQQILTVFQKYVKVKQGFSGFYTMYIILLWNMTQINRMYTQEYSLCSQKNTFEYFRQKIVFAQNYFHKQFGLSVVVIKLFALKIKRVSIFAVLKRFSLLQKTKVEFILFCLQITKNVCMYIFVYNIKKVCNINILAYRRIIGEVGDHICARSQRVLTQQSQQIHVCFNRNEQRLLVVYCRYFIFVGDFCWDVTLLSKCVFQISMIVVFLIDIVLFQAMFPFLIFFRLGFSFENCLVELLAA